MGDEEEARRAEAEEELSRRLAASLEAGRRRAAQEGEARSAARQAAYAELRSEVGHVAAHQEPRRPPIMQHAGFEEEHFMSAVMETAFRAELDLVPQRPAPTEVTGASSASGDPFVIASDEVMQALRVGAEFAHTADGPVIEVSDNPADPTEEGLSPQTRHGSATDDSATAAPWHLMPSVGTWHCSLPLVCDGPSPLSSMETPLLGSTVGSEPQAQEARCDDLSDVLRNSLRARKADGTLEELLDQASRCDGPSPMSSMETPLLGSTVGSEPQAQEARCDDLSDVLRNSLRARKADGTLEELLDQASKL